MHHDGVHAGLLQKRDIAREGTPETDIAHGVAAIFDDDGLVLIALHVGQGGGKQPCLLSGI